MVSGTAPPEHADAEPRPAAPPTQGELLIDQRLRQTRRQLAAVQIADGLIKLAVGTLAYLLAAAVLDHWLISGGLGFAGRLLLFLVLVAAAGGYFASGILPLLIRRIHPLFAAKTIEESRPGMKNSLVNFLFLRKQPEGLGRDVLAKRVYQGLEHTAAAEVVQVDVNTAVDRAPAIHHGYLLVAVLAVACLYLLFSPKSPLVSFRRVLFPWAHVPAPTRVTIDDIQPGDAEAFQGDTVAVSAAVRGLGGGESVQVYYATADGQSVDQAVPMTLEKGAYRHACDLPPGGSGLQQDVTYYLAAGDFRSRPFSIHVQTALAIVVDDVRYDYPKYTGLDDRTVREAGDIRAIEGTRVQLHATANQPIRQAVIELDCDARHGLRMAANGTRATARFTLAMRRDDPTRPQYESYQIRFTDLAGHQSRRPIRHRIDVIPDQPPRIYLVDPPPEAIELPVDGLLELRVRAEDPDFAIRRVAIRAVRDGRSLPIRPLLEKPRPEKAHEGPFEDSYRFEPARLGLEVGDKVDYWAEAYDNKEDQKGPAPNRSETPRRRITIVARDGRQPPEKSPEKSPDPSGHGRRQSPEGQKPSPRPDQQQADQGGGQPPPQELPPDGPKQQEKPSQPREPGQEGSQPDQPRQDEDDHRQPEQQEGSQQGQGQGQSSDQAGQPSDQHRAGEQGEPEGGQPGSQPGAEEPADSGQGAGGQQAGGQQGAEGQQGAGARPSRRPIDAETNPGDAFEEVLKYRAEQEPSGEPSESPQQPGQQPGSQAEPDGAPGQGPRQGQAGTPSTDQPPSDGPGPSPPGDAQGGKPSAAQQGEGGRKEAKAPGQQGEGTGHQAEPQRTPDNEQAGSPTGGGPKEPGAGQGAKSQGPGEPLQEQTPGEGGEKPEASGGDSSEAKGEGGAGKPASQSKGAPSPQEANQPRDKTAGRPDQSPSSQDGQAQSPSISPKQSDSQGDTAGDRSGGGEEGGGQKSPQSGTGTAGTHTAAEQGGSRSDQQGEGETGPGAGDRVKADRPTGESASQEQGPGSARRKKPGGQGSAEKPDQQPAASSGGESSPSERPGSGEPRSLDAKAQGPSGSGNPVTGGAPGRQTTQPPSQEQGPLGGEDVNLDFARQQTELALEYLEDQLAQDQPDPELLDRLGWSREDLESFVRQWQQMRRAVAGQGEAGEKAGRELDEALRSLGLRPRSTQLRGGSTTQDEMRRLKDSRRFDPPARWKALFEAYTRSISSPRRVEAGPDGR